MKKRMISLLLTAVFVLTMLSAVLAEGKTVEELLGINNPEDWPKTMYVYTENGGKLNVRREPKTGNNVIDQLEYGTEVIVEGLVVINADWAVIRNKKGENGVAYVMTRYLVNEQPKDTKKRREEAERKANLEELNKQLASATSVDQPFMIAVRAARASGWVNLRWAPSVDAERITTCPQGKELTVLAETKNWYQVQDPATGMIGFIMRQYVQVR